MEARVCILASIPLYFFIDVPLILYPKGKKVAHTKMQRIPYFPLVLLLFLIACSTLESAPDVNKNSFSKWLVENEPWEWMFEGVGLAIAAGLVGIGYRYWQNRSER